MKNYKRIGSLLAVILLLVPFFAASLTAITTAYASEEPETIVVDETDKAAITLAYTETAEGLDWTVAVTKAASEQKRTLSFTLELQNIAADSLSLTSRNEQATDNQLHYTSEATTDETNDTLHFTTPKTQATLDYQLVPVLEEETAEGITIVSFEQAEYDGSVETPAATSSSETETAINNADSDPTAETAESENHTSEEAADTTDSVAEDTSEATAVNEAAAIPNPLAGTIGANLLQRAIPVTNSYDYSTDNGSYLTNGTASGDTYNYNYGSAPEAEFDEEDYVNYDDTAYLKKYVTENNAKQGLFDVTLDVKGNQTEHPVDLVLVLDFSSSMTGTKLENAIAGVAEFLEEIDDALNDSQVKVALVAYNRYVYSTGDFLTDKTQLTSFLRTTAESHSGTFIQKGLYEAENLFATKGRSDAQKMLIHIGDGSANRAYLPQENATVYQNNGEIQAVGGYSANTYVTEFQTTSEQFYNTSQSSDSNSILLGKAELANLTLGTAVYMKTLGIEMYSVGVNPTDRGAYIAQNLATNASRYMTIDEELAGLGESLGSVASQIDKSISNGTITDPMGDHILLQQQGAAFGSDDYQLTGWRKDASGTWQTAPDLVADVVVREANGTIQLHGLTLGRDERVSLTYSIRINTEANDFQADSWYLANGQTTLDPTSSGNPLDFPVPSVKAPGIQLTIHKQWQNDSTAIRPENISFTVTRETTTGTESWVESEPLTLSASNNWQLTIQEVTPTGTTQTSQLPLYNNQGDPFSYSVNELLDDDRYSSDVTVNDTVITMTNTLRVTDLTFYKFALNGDPLSGATFELLDADGQSLGTAVSNSQGEIHFTDLTVGRYTLKELVAPTGYQPLGREIPIEVRADENGTLSIWVDYEEDGDYVEWTDKSVYNVSDPTPSLPTVDFSFTKLGETTSGSAPLDQVTFKLTSLLDRGVSYTATSTATGEVAFDNLPIGVYVLEELSTPDGYDPIAPMVVRIYEDSNGDLVVDYPADTFTEENNSLTLLNKASIDIALTKVTDAQQILPGAIFELQDEQGQRVAGPLMSNRDGQLTFEDIPQGTYYLVEIRTPVGFQTSDPVKLVIDYDANNQLTIVEPNKWNHEIVNQRLTDFSFQKQDEQGNPLRGAVFELQDTAGNTLYGPVVSDSNGAVTFTDIVKGTYQLVEVSAPDNYYLTNAITITIDYDQNNQLIVTQPTSWSGIITNQAKTIDLQFTKTDEEHHGLAGAVFELRDEQGRLAYGPVTSAADGTVAFPDIRVGTYYLVETSAPEGFDTINPIKIVVGLDDQKEPVISEPASWQEDQTITDSLLTADFLFTKVDYLGNPLAGATFELQDTAGNLIQGPVTTDNNGDVVFTGLTIGDYLLVETQAPAGYQVREPVPIKVAVEEDGRLIATPDLGDYVELWDGNIYNMPDVAEPKPTAEFPFIKMGATADGAIPLEGVTFELTPLYSGSTYQATSDANGKVNFTGVAAGFYALREIDYPDGYVPNDPVLVRVYWDEHGFLHVDYPEEEFEVNEDGLPVVVNHQATALQLKKVDEFNRPLADAEFQLLDKEGNSVGDPQISDENGQLHFTNLTAGTYQLVETRAPAGYTPHDPIELTIDYDSEGQLVVVKPDDWDGIISNQQIIDVPFTKIDADGNVLSGAEFELQDMDGNRIAGPVTTDYEGNGLFTDLGKGTYYLVETQAPDGYQKLTEPIKLIIDYNEEHQLTVTAPEDWTGDIVNEAIETPPTTDSSDSSDSSDSTDTTSSTDTTDTSTSSTSGSTSTADSSSSSSSTESTKEAVGGGNTSSSNTGKKKTPGTLLNTGEVFSSVYTWLGLGLLISISSYLLWRRQHHKTNQ